MGVRIPERNLSDDVIQRRPPVNNSQNIIAVRGNNPYARAIDQLAPIIANALIQRQQMKEQARQAALVRQSIEQGTIADGISSPENILDAYKAISSRNKQDDEGKRSYTVFETEFRKDPEKYRILESSGVNLKIIKDAASETRDKNLDRRDKEIASKLRSQFLTQSKPFSEISQAYNRVQTAASQPTAAGDLSLIYNYMKILDPLSVVRESEFAQAAATGSYGERTKAYVNRILEGKRLSDDIRNDFLFQAKQLYDGQEKLHAQRESEFQRIASEQNINPRSVVINVRNIDTTQQPLGTNTMGVVIKSVRPRQ